MGTMIARSPAALRRRHTSRDVVDLPEPGTPAIATTTRLSAADVVARARRARAVAQPAFKQVLAAFNRRWKLLTPLTKVGETGQDHQVQLWHLCSSQRDIRP